MRKSNIVFLGYLDMKKVFVLATTVVLLALGSANAQQPNYDVNFTSTPPVIDGVFTIDDAMGWNAGDDEWAGAGNEGGWTMRQTQNPDINNFSFRMLWDDENLYMLGRGEAVGWNEEGRESIPAGFSKTWNIYFDPNIIADDGTNGDNPADGYQIAFATPEGFSEIPAADPADTGAAVFIEAHTNTNWGNNSGDWSNFTNDPNGGGDSLIQMKQFATNGDDIDGFGSTVFFEMALPWETFNAGNPANDPPGGDFGLFHPTAPIDGEEWNFTIAYIPAEGELPSWHNQTVGAFAAVPHGGLTFFRNEVMPADCDFNGDGTCDVVDLDELLYTGLGTNDGKYDLDNSGGEITLADRDAFLTEVNSFPGDFNMDGQVTALDLNVLGGNWTADGLTSYAQGDSNGDGVADARDLNDLGGNWQNGVAAASAVPEPNSCLMILTGLIGLLSLRRNK